MTKTYSTCGYRLLTDNRGIQVQTKDRNTDRETDIQ